MSNIRIVADDGNRIRFQLISEDEVNRDELKRLEDKINSNDELKAKLETENKELIEKWKYAVSIVKLADEQAQATPVAEESEEVEG